MCNRLADTARAHGHPCRQSSGGGRRHCPQIPVADCLANHHAANPISKKTSFTGSRSASVAVPLCFGKQRNRALMVSRAAASFTAGPSADPPRAKAGPVQHARHVSQRCSPYFRQAGGVCSKRDSELFHFLDEHRFKHSSFVPKIIVEPLLVDFPRDLQSAHGCPVRTMCRELGACCLLKTTTCFLCILGRETESMRLQRFDCNLVQYPTKLLDLDRKLSASRRATMSPLVCFGEN